MNGLKQRLAAVVDVSGTADGARLGSWLIGFQGVVIALTAWWVQAGDGTPYWALGLALGLVLSGVGAGRLPWSRWPGGTLAAFPYVAFLFIAILGQEAPDTAPAYVSLLTLWFMFVGIVAPVHTGWRLLPAAVLTWLIMQQQLHAEHVVRIALSAATWVVLSDVIAMRAAVSQVRTDDLTHQAGTDPLTQLPNRRALDSALTRLQEGDIVVVLDLDHFKQVNDEHGHAYGDTVLVDYAQTLAAVVRISDMVVRFGGEEFVLILPQSVSQGAGAASVLSRLRGYWYQQHPQITWSAGAACHQAGADPRLTLRDADRALYLAKRTGRDRVVTSGDARELIGLATVASGR